MNISNSSVIYNAKIETFILQTGCCAAGIGSLPAPHINKSADEWSLWQSGWRTMSRKLSIARSFTVSFRPSEKVAKHFSCLHMLMRWYTITVFLSVSKWRRYFRILSFPVNRQPNCRRGKRQLIAAYYSHNNNIWVQKWLIHWPFLAANVSIQWKLNAW